MKKTITTFLLSDNPNGIKLVWVVNRVCRCMYLTRARADFEIAQAREELNQPALYFLFGEDKAVYIGETENFNKRIIDHNQKKDFWNEILVFFSGDHSLSKSEVQYLECLAIRKTDELKNYTLEENKQNPNFPNLEENKIEIVKDFFEEVIFLSSFLNFNLFESYKTEEENYWFCGNNKGTKAKSIVEGKKIIILVDSKICKDTVESFRNKELREDLLKKNADEEKEYFSLSKNIEFITPSSASNFCLGASSNGWVEWKNKSGKTMDEVLRNKPTEHGTD